MAQQKIQSSQLSDTGVVPGAYVSTSIIVDSAGRITFIDNGSSGGYIAGNLIDPILLETQEISVRDIVISPVGTDNNILIGPGAGVNFSTGTGNVVIGALAGDNITEGSNNVFIGIESGHDVVSGFNNILIGYQAGKQQAINGGGSLQDSFIINNENIRDPALHPPYIRGRILGTNSTLQIAASLYVKDDEDVIHFGFTTLGEVELDQNPGEPGQVLTSQGVGLPVYWGEGGGGGIVEPLGYIVVGSGSGVEASSAFTYSAEASTLYVGDNAATIILGPSENFSHITADGAFPGLTLLNQDGINFEFSAEALFRFLPDGDIELFGGSVGNLGDVLTSGGPGNPAVWAPGGSGSQPLNQIVFGTGSGVTSASEFTFDPAVGLLTIDGAGEAIIEAGTDENLRLIGLQTVVETELLTVTGNGTSFVETDVGQNLIVRGDEIIFETGDSTRVETFAFGVNGEFFVDGDAGTLGQVLTSQGTSASPIWAAAAATTEFEWNTQTEDYQIQLSDANNGIVIDSTENVIVRIPSEVDIGGVFPNGTKITITSDNIGSVIVAPAAFVTLHVRSPLPTQLAGQYAVATLIKRGLNNWYLYGDLG